jgi:6-phosphogluconolactonase
MSKSRVYIGTYSKNVYYGEFDVKSGELSITGQSPEVENPSYLCLSGDGNTLYAASETEDGSAVSIDLRSNTITSARKTHGAHPCHLYLHEGRLLASNYSEGTLSVFALDGEGRLAECVTSLKHHGGSVNPERQDKPHIHSATLYMGRLAVCDLGLDKVMLYSKTAFDAEPLDCPPGSGPRHSVAVGDFLYVNTEMGNTVLVFREGQLIQEVSTLPAGYSGVSHTAAMKLSPDKKYIAVSNRGHDSLAYYKIGDDGKLTLIGFIESPETPRDFAFSPDGGWILCGGQDDNIIRRYRIEGESVTDAGIAAELPSPVCFVFG